MEDLARRIRSLSPEKRLLLELQLQRKNNLPEAIAVVGIGCRFPGAENPRAFWQLLTEGRDAIRQVPPERWDVEAFYDHDPTAKGKSYCRWGGFLDAVDQFDPTFFGIAPKEAAYIDPQQRLFLEVVWEALEDAGIVPSSLNGQAVGVFAGASTLDYGQLLLRDTDAVGTYTTTGLASTMVANRISYLLNLQGPSLTVDTACSSSLVATHLACRSLWQQETDLALAGGVNLILTPALTVGFSKLTALSPDGRCKAFDAAANGFVRSEGAGVVVLKRLSQALADGDSIYGLIRGSAVNQDGRTNGLTAPNRASQEAVVRAAYQQAGIPLNRVDYIEAHGTGTLLGDPIEAKALGNVFKQFRSTESPLRIGSVKSNLGHAEAAAGIASLIKVALCLQHRQFVPTLHFHQPNPYIPFDDLRLRVQQTCESWRAEQTLGIAGISSFGFGGTNAHLVMQGVPAPLPSDAVAERPQQLFCLSAQDKTALVAYADQMAKALTACAPTDLGNFCYTVNAGRTAFSHRLVTLADHPQVLADKLKAFVAGQGVVDLHCGQGQAATPVVFMFTGQGSQYEDMGRQLYETQPVFRAALERCDEILQSYLDRSLLEVLYPEKQDPENRDIQDQDTHGVQETHDSGFKPHNSTGPLHQTQYTQPALFALEYALAELWQAWGVRPAAVVGHSIGEYVAACVAGVLSLEDTLRLVAQRGKLMQSLPQNGSMVAVLADENTVTEAIQPFTKTVSLATLNGPDNSVIAGLRQDVETVCQQLAAQGIQTKPLTVSHAFHSPLMDPILNLFEQTAATVQPQPARIPLVSNLTGQFLQPGALMDGIYWRRHAREPVRFADAITTLQKAGYQLFLEMGPHPVLSSIGRRCVEDPNITWLPSLRRGQSDWQQLLLTLGQLYLKGMAIHWPTVEAPYARRKLSLPTYPFQRQRYWVDLPTSQEAAVSMSTSVTTGNRPTTETHSSISTPSESTWQGAAYTLRWQIQNGAEAQAPEPHSPATVGTWLLWGAEIPGQAALVTALKRLGIQPIYISQGTEVKALAADHYQVLDSSFTQCRALLTQLEQAGIAPLQQVLFSCSSPHFEEGKDRIRPPAMEALGLIQALAEFEDQVPPKLWLITQAAQVVATSSGSDTPIDPFQATLWGLGRTLRLEHPDLWGGLIDVVESDRQPGHAPAWVEPLIAHVLSQDGEDEVALRGQDRFVPRLIKSAPLVATPQQQSAIALSIPVKADGTYLITGGTGGLGQQIVHWLVQQGAKTLVLLSRRGETPAVQAVLEPLRQQGITLWVETLDVSDSRALKNCLQRLRHQLPPLKGVIHAAGTLADGFLVNQSPQQFQRVMEPKLQAAWFLHQLTTEDALDWFVLFSSLASLIGSPGQANYGAANAFLDALAHHRQQQGLPAMSISWGPWQSAGMATRQANSTLALADLPGIEPLSPEMNRQWFAYLLHHPQPHVGVAALDWQALKHYLPTPTLPPVFGAMLALSSTSPPAQTQSSSKVAEIPGKLLLHLLDRSPDDRISDLQAYFQAQVATVTGLQKAVPLDRSLLELGIDSLMTMDLLANCKRDLGLVLYPREVFAHPTVAALAHYVALELDRVHTPVVSSSSQAKQAAIGKVRPDVVTLPPPSTNPTASGISESLTPSPIPATWTVNPADLTLWPTSAPLESLPSPPNPKSLFLLSSPRSGSTLLRVMLAGHRDLFCPPELHLLPFNTLAERQTALGDSYLQEGLVRALMELLALDANAVQGLLQEWSQHGMSMPAVYNKLQQMAAPRLVMDKSPTYSLSLETLQRAEQVFEDAHYIHLVRHPYAVIESFVRNRMYKIFDLEPENPYELAEQVWYTSNQNIQTFLQGLPPHRYHQLRYEDLVSAPETRLEELCQFLGLPFDPAVLTPYEGQRMTDGVRARSLAVDDPNFQTRQHIDASLAAAWQKITLPSPLNPASAKLAQYLGYTLPQSQRSLRIEQEQVQVPTLPPFSRLREDWVTVRGRQHCICHWDPQSVEAAAPQVFCIHGILEHGAVWDAMASELTQRLACHITAPDLRGHGRSDHAGVEGNYQLVDFLADLDELTQEVAASGMVLVGHSMGAVLAAILTSLSPERVQQLVLIEPVVPTATQEVSITSQLSAHLSYLAHPPEPVVMASFEEAVQRIRKLKPQLSPLAAQKMAERLVSPQDKGVCWRWDPKLQARTALGLGNGLFDRDSYAQMLSQIQVPITLVFGNQSQFNRPEDLALLTTALPQAHTIFLDGGHDLPSEVPGDLVRILQTCIQETL